MHVKVNLFSILLHVGHTQNLQKEEPTDGKINMMVKYVKCV